jgi:hypothetical protein
MRVLLLNPETGLYFQSGDDWTARSEEAHSFRHSAEAMQIAGEKGMRNLEVVLAFDTPQYEVKLPLP